MEGTINKTTMRSDKNTQLEDSRAMISPVVRTIMLFLHGSQAITYIYITLMSKIIINKCNNMGEKSNGHTT